VHNVSWLAISNTMCKHLINLARQENTSILERIICKLKPKMDANDDALLLEIRSAMERNNINVVQHELEHQQDLLTCCIDGRTMIVHFAWCCHGKMDIVILF